MSSFDNASAMEQLAKHLDLQNEAKMRQRGSSTSGPLAVPQPGGGPRGSASGRSSGSIPSSPAVGSLKSPASLPAMGDLRLSDELETFNLRAMGGASHSHSADLLPKHAKQLAPSVPSSNATAAPASSAPILAAAAGASVETVVVDNGTAGKNKPPKPVRADLVGKVFEKRPELTKAERRAKQDAEKLAKMGGVAPAAAAVAHPPASGASPSSALTAIPASSGASATAASASAGLSSSIPKESIVLQHDDVRKMRQHQRSLMVPRESIPQHLQVALFTHLAQHKRLNLSEAKLGYAIDDVHPSIVRLGLKYADGQITGAIARCVAFLEAVQEMLDDYECPAAKSFSEDWMLQLGKCIRFLDDCRPKSVTMGNAISFLKRQVQRLAPSMSHDKAKEHMSKVIDDFLNERIVHAQQGIIDAAEKKIVDGDVILTYAHSHVIELLLKHVKSLGRRFRVIVVDSRPKLEGKEMARRLVAAGIECSYAFLNALAYVMPSATKVFLGAASMLSNGTAVSRAGTAMVAMMANSVNKPTLLCCETLKFSKRVQLDSLCSNELGDPDDLARIDEGRSSHLGDWIHAEDVGSGSDGSKLKLLNLIYDLTPAASISVVITELGLIPPTSVPVVIRVYLREFSQ